MRINNVCKILLISSCAVLFTACSTTKHGANSTAPGQAGAAGAETSAVNQEGSFDEQAANKLKVADQVYYFDFDKYDLKSSDLASVKVQADYLAKHRNAKIRLEGNADDRGSREYNVALGWKRAKAVNAMLMQEGVTKNQVVMVSYGKEKPVAFGHDETSFSKNRRVELKYESK